MTNKKTAVQQAYLERAQVLKETEGAPESTRVALSAISGRNILKTKKETAKIERDKQIAAMQQQALLQQGAANSALKMGQAKLSAAIQQDRNQRADAFLFMDAGVYDDTLAATLDAQQAQAMQYAEIVRQNSALEQQRRSEAISILKMGVYDPSVAQALGMSESVVKSFADQRAAEIEDARTKKAAAKKAQADYEAALENLQAENAKTQKKEEEIAAWYETEVDSAIDTFEKESVSFDDANAAKKQILSSVNTEKAVIPWAEPAFKIDLTPKSAGQLVLTPINAAKTYDEEETKKKNNVGFDYFQQKKANALPNDGVGDPRRAYQEKKENERISAALEKKEKRLQQAKEQREVELATAKKNREAAERYYEQAMAKRVATKEAADQALSALETAYKESALGKVYIAKEKINSALTLEEQRTAYQNFADQITSSYKDIASRSSKILTSAGDRYNAGENLAENELKSVQNVRDELDGLRVVLQDAISSGMLTTESKQGYRNGISNIEKVIASLEAMEVYAQNYNEDNENYRVMDEKYSDMTLEQLEAKRQHIEDELEEEYTINPKAADDFWSNINVPHPQSGNTLSYVEEINREKKRRNTEAIKKDSTYFEYENLKKYIDQRRMIEENLEQNRKAIMLSSDFEGETDAERISNAIDSVGAGIDEFNAYRNLYNRQDKDELLHSYSLDRPEWFGEDKISVNGQERYVRYFKAANGEKWLLEYYGDDLPVGYRSFDDIKTIYGTNLEKQRILTNTYHRISEDAAVGSLEGQDVDQLVAEFVSDYDADAFRNLGGKKDKYAHGDEYKSKGWLSSFYTDVDRFVEGEYGWFTEEDANTVLALLQNAGEDETKQDIAFSYYTKALERAKRNEAEALGDGKWVAGMVSGVGEFLTNGVFMLDNALTRDYSRVQQTMFSAAHQLTMEEFSQKTGFANDTLEFLYQAGYTLVDMVPVVVLSAIPYVGSAAGSGYLYAKSLATTYDTSIRNGKRADEAFTYATLTAASEVLLEKAFSGIKNVGGSKSLGNTFSKAIEKLSTTQGMKTTLKLFGNMGSEGFEEFLQEVLSPFLEKIAADVNGMTDAELSEIDWDEAGKSFLLGAITGGVFSAFDLGTEYANANQSAILSKIALQGEGRNAIKIIQMAADLGNQRALRIKTAMQNKSPIYKDQAGVRQYASEADITNLRKSIRSKNKKVLLQNIRAELDADPARDHSADNRIYGIFKELLLNHRLDVHQTADLINDATALKILNRITGENVGAMMPTDAMYLARLASFTDKDGQVDHARIDALRDSFGELDYKAIEQILKYEDIVADQRAEGNFSGVLYEDPAVQDGEQSDAINEMELLSGMTGKFYLISDQYESGSYLSKDVVTIRSEDVEKGAFYLLGHKAYYMMKQLNAEKADVVKSALLDEIEGMIGEQGIELEKKKLRQQGFDEAVLDDELCARMMPVVFLQGDYKIVEEIAKEDIEAANQLRNVIGSIREHLAENYIEKISAPEAVEASGIVRFEKGVKPKNKQQRLAVAFSKHIASAIGIDIVFYDSEIPGTFGANANGYFYGADNSIHLDLRKTKADEGAIVFTLSHELVHFAQKFSAEKYNALADFLVENYGTETMEQLIQKKMEQLKTTDRDLAKREVIADACERMLLDSDAMVKLQELKKRDQGLLETIKQHIQALLDKVRAMLANIKPTSPEGVALQQMTDVLEQAHAMFEDMIVDAANTYRQTGGDTLVDGGVKFSLKKDRNGNTYWQIETGKDIFKNLSTPKQFEAAAFNYILGKRDNNKIVEAIDGKKMTFIRLSAEEFTNSNESQELKAVDPIMFAQKMRLIPSLEDLAANASVNWHSPDHKNHKLFKKRGFENFRGRVGIDNVIFNFVIRAGKAHFGDVFYDINLEVDSILPHAIGTSGIQKPTSNTNISNSSQNVNHPKQKKQNYFSSSTFSDAMADMVSQETTELYDRLSEAVEKHYGTKDAVDASFDPSADAEGVSFVYTSPDQAQRKIEQQIADFEKTNELSADEIEYCKNMATGDRSAVAPYEHKESVYKELIGLYKASDVPVSSNELGTTRFEDMAPEQQERYLSARQMEIDGYLEALVEFGSVVTEEVETKPEDFILTDILKRKKPLGATAKRAWNWWRRKWTDSGATVYDLGKAANDPHLYHYYNAARASTNSAVYMVLNKQTDIYGKTVGKGLNEIFKPIMERGDYYEFQLYLFHMHNIDRMSRESQRAAEHADEVFQTVVDAYPELKGYTDNEIKNLALYSSGDLQVMAQDYVEAMKSKEYWSSVKNAPVFGPEVTADDSRMAAKGLLSKHPEFKELAEEVYQYSRNLLQYRVDSGLITKEFSDKLQQIYPHYVPTAREDPQMKGTHINAIETDRVQVGKAIKRVKGGSSRIIPLHKQLADQTMSVVREGAKNRFGARLLEYGEMEEGWPIKKIEKVSDRILPIVTFDGQIDMVDPFVTQEFQNVFSVFIDGEQYNMEITQDLFEAIEAIAPNKEASNWLTDVGQRSVNLYKKLITAYNPAFAIRNFARDMQDALFYSKDLKGFISNYLPAIREMKENGELWQQYCALGGMYSSVYNFDTGMETHRGKVRKALGRIEALNGMIEQLPRFAEFMTTVKKGNGSMNNLMEGIYNAADITTNFGRSGEWGKFLNRSFVPFFNPGVQGFSRAVRALTETKGARAWGSLVIKAAVLGFAPALINGILWDDDEEWEIINQRDKDVNYLFKVGDGIWVKIPKGRVLSVLGMSAERVKQVVGGEDVDWAEYFSTVGDQIAPANPLTANVLAGIMSVGYNKTWYGGDIVSQSMQNLPKEEQYDAQTDIVSVWLGKLLNQSPKKINYILDQYTGVAGDILLPALSVASERDFWSKAFTIDTDYSNRLSGDFYDELQKLTEKKNSVSGTAVDEAKYRWWNRKATELSTINKETKSVQADSSLSKEDKKERLDVLYAGRNALILSVEGDSKQYFETVERVAVGLDLSEDDAADVVYREANRKMFGAEEALKMYNKDTYERAVKVRDEMGIDFETFYNVYFDDTVSNDQMFKMLQSGMDYDGAAEISKKLNVLEPEDGAQSVSYMQKYEAIAETDVTDETKLAAMKLFATDADRRRVTIGNEYGITLDQFINVKSNIEALNEMEGKTTASNARIEAAVRHQSGLTDKQRAVLWQVFTSSDSAKKNPFSIAVGAETLKKIEEAKVKEE